MRELKQSEVKEVSGGIRFFAGRRVWFGRYFRTPHGRFTPISHYTAGHCGGFGGYRGYRGYSRRYW